MGDRGKPRRLSQMSTTVKSFRKLQKKIEKLTAHLSEYSGVPEDIVEKVIYYSKCLPKPGSTEIDRSIFMAEMSTIFGITNSFMTQSMYEAIKHPRRKTATIDEYAKCICTMLSHDLDLKIDFVYTVYDINSDDSLSYTEMYYFLKPCVISSPNEEEAEPGDSVKELIELVLKTTDIDENGAIDREEFRALVKKDVLYLQLLGPCLPEEAYLKKFRELLESRTKFQVRTLFSDERAKSLQSVDRKVDTGYYPIELELP